LNPLVVTSITLSCAVSNQFLGLDPRRGDTVSLVSAVTPFRDDALEIALTRGGEQVAAAALQMVHVEQPRINARHDGSQAALAFDQKFIDLITNNQQPGTAATRNLKAH
jgi:hypothetical protein